MQTSVFSVLKTIQTDRHPTDPIDDWSNSVSNSTATYVLAPSRLCPRKSTTLECI